MNEENTRIREWLEKYNAFYNESIPKLHLLYKEYGPKSRRRRETTRWYHFRTQSIRKEIARLLGDLLDLAVAFAKDNGLDLSERQKWTRLAAYLGQTINTTLNSHDTVAIEKTLDKLNRYVEKHVG